MVRGLFAALWKGARGGSAALVCDARGATAVFCSNARGVQFSVPALLPEGRRSFVSSSVRVQVGSLLCRSGRSKVRRCNARVPCVRTRAEVRGTTVYASDSLPLGDIEGISASPTSVMSARKHRRCFR